MSTAHNGKRRIAQKWGFGMAPISKGMRERYDGAVRSVSDFIDGSTGLDEVSLECFSELKGMFNRCVRQDQWDWFTVYSEFGRPPFSRMRHIANKLTELRRACLDKDERLMASTIEQLSNFGLAELLRRYQWKAEGPIQAGKSGWIYVLSTREQPDVLKIGMTQRSVEERVKEINSATGVAIPFSARGVFLVNDARVAERRVFERLDSFRIRSDREFFQLPFHEASIAIRECLNGFGLKERPKGKVAWIDHVKGYGFLDYDQGQSVFLHLSQVSADEVGQLESGTILEFDLAFGEKGMSARRAKVVSAVQHTHKRTVG